MKFTNCGYNNRGHVVLREGQNFAAEVRSQHVDIFMSAYSVQQALRRLIKAVDGDGTETANRKVLAAARAALAKSDGQV